jgi:cation transport regulator ChaB
MPYASIDALPDDVKTRYSARCQRVFLETFNNAMSSSTGGGAASEESAFKIAHTAAGNCKAAGKSNRSPVAMTDMTVKFAEGSDTTIEGLGVPFGLDLDGESFGPETDLCLDWFPNGGRPILYHHGFNDTVKMAAIGHEVESKLTDAGLWVRAELDKSSKYYERVKQLVEKGAVGWSSGAPDHKVKTGKNGRYQRWPPVEFSLTPTPSFPNRVSYAVKTADAIEHLQAVDTEIPEPLNASEIEDGMVATADAARDAAKQIQQSIGDPEPESLADQSERVLAGVKAWAERMEERSDFRVKYGRELSKANIETLREAHRIIGALLERVDQPSEEEQRASKAKAAYAEYLRLEAGVTG